MTSYASISFSRRAELQEVRRIEFVNSLVSDFRLPSLNFVSLHQPFASRLVHGARIFGLHLKEELSSQVFDRWVVVLLDRAIKYLLCVVMLCCLVLRYLI
jgi:hypothetical protein